jgi:galactose mutarotase-like enzyme
MCVAMEPATAPTDALATMGAWTRWIEPGETTHWPMDVEIQHTAKSQ